MWDLIVDGWEWIVERFQDLHEIMCDIPTVGDLFEQYPVVGYGILLAAIAATIWMSKFDGVNKFLQLYRG